MADPPKHIVFTGGGTGGHLFPGLAVAEQLARKMPRTRITFVGSGKPFERRHVTGAGWEYLAVPCRGWSGKLRQSVSFVFENMAGYLAARRFLSEEQVDLVVGLGGYASVPTARAAVRQHVPLVLLEQNATPGKATRWLARSASLVCTSLAETESHLRCGCPVRLTGNPIRQQPKHPTSTSAPLLLISGGSHGAGALNEHVPKALYKIRSKLVGWQIVHQSGQSDHGATESLYRKLGLCATVVPFITDMPSMLARAELAVCRAGGTTLAELAAAEVPAVLVPYPHAAADHQRRNAQSFCKAGGALMIDQQEGPGRLDDRLADALTGLLEDPPRRHRMATLLARLARPDAASEVANHIMSLLSTTATLPAAA